MRKLKLGKYQHSKTGNYYQVLGTAKHSETLEEFVIYECLYENPESKVWIRPKKMFLEQVIINGQKLPRFKYIEQDGNEKSTKIRNMQKQIIKPKGVTKPPSPFNHIIKAGNLLFLSSQLSLNLQTNTLLKGTISQQTKQALENIKYLLESCGSKMEDIVKVVIYMRDVKQFAQMNTVYRQYFPEGEEPTRVAIQAVSPLPGIDIEIEVTAIQQKFDNQ